ncbi:MAG TPA: nicotinate (nicotinamide) nucleotide adenylyltransferase [Oscillospiraceae bacterium]|nr:nicotinate (nicotinamide) nucleotide adenylyltransferase [Oscillospiraceae bacterium]
MNVGVYGGTFNPVHNGHVEAARQAVEALSLDRLLLVPAALPPHKDLPKGTETAAQRLQMVKFAADCIPRAEASDIELRRPGKSYTADTLAALRETYPDARFFLLVGTDMFLTLQSWKRPEEIAKCGVICAMYRAASDTREAMERQKRFLEETFGAEVVLLDNIPLEAASSDLRAALARGEDVSLLLPEQVFGYILREKLYGTNADLKRLALGELRAVSYSMVKAKRIPHIRGTEGECVRLALRWGADAEAARRAAILHDCTKYLTLDEQLKLCELYGIVTDSLEKVAVKLLHAKTGAAIAGRVFGMPPEICDAIRFHTTGKPDMTTLEKVLYLGDYIEPTRDFPGVDGLRHLAYEDLDAALVLGFDMTIREMEAAGSPVHERTLAARAYLCNC